MRYLSDIQPIVPVGNGLPTTCRGRRHNYGGAGTRGRQQPGLDECALELRTCSCYKSAMSGASLVSVPETATSAARERACNFGRSE